MRADRDLERRRNSELNKDPGSKHFRIKSRVPFLWLQASGLLDSSYPVLASEGRV